MAPGYLRRFTFLGQDVQSGLSPVLAEVLTAVEADLVQQWSGQGSAEDFFTWAGLGEPSKGWRPGSSYHGSGSAVDLNYTSNPYIVTRTGGTLGGEASAAGQVAMRRACAAVYDRAVAFAMGDEQVADVSIRVNDTIEATYDRFRLVSDSLTAYFSWAFSTEMVVISRPPIPEAESLPDGDSAFNAISPGARCGCR